jgi:hypothetical protein
MDKSPRESMSRGFIFLSKRIREELKMRLERNGSLYNFALCIH